MSRGYEERFCKALAEHVAAKKKLQDMIGAAIRDADYWDKYEAASEDEMLKAATLGRVVSAELSKLAEEKPYDGDLLMRKYLNTGLDAYMSFEQYKANLDRMDNERRCCE